jgi:hypothetical protein
VLGIAGLKAACEAVDTLYGYSYSGPFRVRGLGNPEEIGQGLPDTIAAISDPQRVIVRYDETVKQVKYFYDTNGVRKRFASFDIDREVWLGPDSDLGVGISCANRITPIVSSAVAGDPPAGAPTSAVTSSVGSTSAVASWTNGDSNPETLTTVEYRRQGTTTWIPVTTVPASTTSVTITGLSASTDYEWRAAHIRNGQLSAYLGPVAGSQFTTSSSGGGGGMAPPTNLSLSDITTEENLANSLRGVQLSWTNSGESDAYTECYRSTDNFVSNNQWFYTANPGWAQVGDTIDPGTWYYRIRHVRGGESSAYTAIGNITV